ncbi:signal peptide peptidase SppA [Comamonas thiooxydans]|uniref:signal peptide peptidase SppA n=1 Tax=Comamonas thiooxydans TaxID=363952 RepID=UPI00070EF96E|nr:signal peptide peptidase SppA [Comamonas thiooxydans]
MKSYLRSAGLIFNQPLLATPDALDMAVRWANQTMNLNIINMPQAGGSAIRTYEDPDDAAAALAYGEERRREAVRATGVQVVPVHGLLVSRGAHMNVCETMTSYEDLRNELRAAVANPDVERIVLDIDSPGGSATGAFELAADLRAMALQKPITGLVNFSAYSGGYLIAAACSEVVVSRTSGVGSIGVIAKHMDRSAMEEKLGVKVTTVFAGAHKNDLSPHEPLTEQSLQYLQEVVNEGYEMFVNAVAEYRGLSVDAVRQTEANVFRGQKAIGLGLADRVETPTDALDNITRAVALSRADKRGTSRLAVRAAAAQMQSQL